MSDCTCDKSISAYDGPSDPAEDCPVHGRTPEHTPQDDTIAPVPADDLYARLSAVMSALGDDRPGAVESVIAAVSPVLERQRIANRALKTAVVEALERAEQAEAERDEARRELAGLRSAVKTVGQALDSLDCPHEAQAAALQRELAEAKQLAAEWQAACEAQSSDADVLTDAIQRVRALHSPETNPRRTRDCKGCRTVATYTLFEDCKTIAALESRPDDPEQIRRLAESAETET